MKLSTSLLYISWIPLIQFKLLRLYGEAHWLFFISIVLSLIGEWLLIKSIPKDSMSHQPVIPVVYIGVLSFIGGGIAVFYLAIFYDPISVNLNIILLYSFLLLIIALVGVWLVETLAKKKPKYRVIISIFISTIFLLTGYATLAMIDYSYRGKWMSRKSGPPLLEFFLLFFTLALLLWGYWAVLKKKKPSKLTINFVLIIFCFFLLYRIIFLSGISKIFEPGWLFFLSVVISLIGVWLLIKSIPKDSKLHWSAIRSIKFVFSSILLFAIPVFFCICEIFDIKIYYSEHTPSPLIISIISAGLLCYVLFLVWKEAQEEDKPYIPVLKFILASIFLLWQLNMEFHYFYEFFHTIPHMYSQSHYFPQRDNIYPSLESYHTLKVLVFSFHIILNLLFFGAIFLKGKFRERQNVFFSFTGCLMVIGVFILNYGLINGTRLITNYYVFNFAIVFTMSFITIMKPILITAVVFTLIGGMLSFSWKGFGHRRVSVPGVICKKGVALVLVTMVLYVFLFGAPWPFQDPAVNVHMRVIINRIEKDRFETISNAKSTHTHFDGLFYYGFLWHGKCAVMPLVNQLEDNSPIKRGVAADFLCYLGDERAVEPLIKTLKDKGKYVRIGAARALGEIKDPRAVEPLIHALKDKDKDFRDTAAIALSVIKDPRAIEPLVEALEKDILTDHARAWIWCLNSWVDPRFIDPLLKKLDDLDDEDVMGRRTIIRGLGGFKDIKIVDTLIERLNTEKSSDLIVDIHYALIRITGQNFNPEIKKKDAKWWQQWWDQNREEFIKKWSTH